MKKREKKREIGIARERMKKVREREKKKKTTTKEKISKDLT